MKGICEFWLCCPIHIDLSWSCLQVCHRIWLFACLSRLPPSAVHSLCIVGGELCYPQCIWLYRGIKSGVGGYAILSSLPNEPFIVRSPRAHDPPFRKATLVIKRIDVDGYPLCRYAWMQARFQDANVHCCYQPPWRYPRALISCPYMFAKIKATSHRSQMCRIIKVARPFLLASWWERPPFPFELDHQGSLE